MTSVLAACEQVRLCDQFERGHGELTLDERLGVLWGELTAGHPVVCPLCGDVFAPRYGAQAAPVGGRCQGCGTTIA
jgi:hypothetical protein